MFIFLKLPGLSGNIIFKKILNNYNTNNNFLFHESDLVLNEIFYILYFNEIFHTLIFFLNNVFQSTY